MDDLIRRGLYLHHGALYITDGGSEINKALKKMFGKQLIYPSEMNLTPITRNGFEFQLNEISPKGHEQAFLCAVCFLFLNIF